MCRSLVTGNLTLDVELTARRYRGRTATASVAVTGTLLFRRSSAVARADEAVEVDSCQQTPDFIARKTEMLTRPRDPSLEAGTLASRCVSYRTIRINRTVCGLLVR